MHIDLVLSSHVVSFRHEVVDDGLWEVDAVSYDFHLLLEDGLFILSFALIALPIFCKNMPSGVRAQSFLEQCTRNLLWPGNGYGQALQVGI